MTTWFIIFAIVVLIAYYATRMADDRETGSRQDTGLAILEFGRAYPSEAIRSLHETADGTVIFVRLHDDKAGMMRNHRSHYACYLIEPGRVRVNPLEHGNGFSAEFLDSPTQNGEYIFASAADASEVLLWLLGNYTRPEVKNPDAGLYPNGRRTDLGNTTA
jgi:hypothetical protein